MNKTYVAIGGVAIVSTAVGGAAGYFIAKRNFDATLDAKIAKEVEATKKYFSVLLMEAKQNKPSTPAEIPSDEIEDEELEEEDDEPVDPEVEENAKAALTNYQGYAKPELAEVASNIFDRNSSPKKKLPPREPGTGKFMPRESREPTPYIITDEQFLVNDPEHEQENLFYFAKEKTLIQIMDREPIDIDCVGEVNLTLFPEVHEGETSSIYVRNEGLSIDYDITLTHESLTEFMGLGESDEDLDEYAGQD